MSDDESDDGRISIDCGGRVFETSTATLLAGGSGYFAALLAPGRAGEHMRGRKRARVSADALAPRRRELFVDRCPELFADVLQFLRSSRLPAAARKDADRLEDLKAEAEFFCLDALAAACDDAVEALQPPPPPEETARCENIFVKAKLPDDEDEMPMMIQVPTGQVMYIQAVIPMGFRGTISALTAYVFEDAESAPEPKPMIIAGHDGRSGIPPLQHTCLTFDGGVRQLVVLNSVDKLTDHVRAGWFVTAWIGHPSKIPFLAAAARPGA